jgi:hypothetical protein
MYDFVVNGVQSFVYDRTRTIRSKLICATSPKGTRCCIRMYHKDRESEYYAYYVHYGRTVFIEFAKRLGIVEVRYKRMINEFIENETAVCDLIKNSTLSEKALDYFITNFKSRIKRLF